MSVITASSVHLKRNIKQVVLWETVTCGDTGSPYTVPDWADVLTVQALGTFQDGSSPAATSTLTMQGSNDGTNYATLHANDGDDVAFQAAGILDIAEMPRYIRPSHNLASGGDVDVYLNVRKR